MSWDCSPNQLGFDHIIFWRETEIHPLGLMDLSSMDCWPSGTESGLQSVLFSSTDASNLH